MLLYRFEPINKNTLINLSRQKFWAADPFLFNDPFEFALRSHYYFDQSQNKMNVLTPEQLKMRKSAEEMMEQFGVLSLAGSRHNKLMWSHYADHHRGICLAFEFDERKTPPIPVKYSNEIPHFNFSEEERFNNFGLFDIMVTKSKEWGYEQEYRRIFASKNQHFDYDAKLVEIAFGCKCPIQDIEMVWRILISLNLIDVKLIRLQMQGDTFSLSESSTITGPNFSMEEQMIRTLEFWRKQRTY